MYCTTYRILISNSISYIDIRYVLKITQNSVADPEGVYADPGPNYTFYIDLNSDPD